MGSIIKGAVFVFLCFSVVPVLNRTVIAGNTAVNLCLFAAFRAGKMLTADISMLRAYGICRRNSVIRQLIILCNFSYKGCGCFPVRKFFSQETMEYRS